MKNKKKKTRVIHVLDRRTVPGPDYVYIGRPSMWGNPHPIGSLCPRCQVRHTRTEAIAAFNIDFLKDKKLQRAAIQYLCGRVLGCWCVPAPCHGHIYVKFCNAVLDALES